MISHKINHPKIAKFLLHYLKSKQNSSTEEKKKTIETVIDFLFFLESSPTTCKSLFGIQHFSFGLKIAKSCRAKLEKMIGGKLDEASLDNLLVPGARGMYDVDLVLRLVRVFVSERSSSDRMKKVAALVDAYMGEIAPEKSLKREKFVGMLRALPDGARTSYDGVYRAVDVFLQVRENFLLRVSHWAVENDPQRIDIRLGAQNPGFLILGIDITESSRSGSWSTLRDTLSS